jgi:hypothetical protein
MPLVQPPDMSIPGPTGKPGGIGERLENVLVRFLGRMLNGAKATLAGIIRFALDTFLEGIEPFMIRAYKPVLNLVRNQTGCPGALIETIDTALSGTDQAGAAVLGMLGTSIGSAVIGSFVGTLTAPLTMYVNSKVLPQRPDLGTLQALLRRKAISLSRFGEMLGELGWSNELNSAIEQLTHPRPDIGVLAGDAFRRELPLETLRDELTRRGFLPPDINAILNVLKPIPGAGDLISMAVREAWDDGVAGRYGYDADFPAPFAEWMKKQGYDDEWAHRWWRAHWEVPGPTIAREMLHRTDMTEGDYATLLKVADYPQRWRQWMTEVAYEPYTRVDIRRMYQVGVLKTYAELVRAYKDIGYKDDKAQKLADFTVLEYGETEREATKVEVLSAYGIGRLSQAETRGYLVEMGYPGWVIETYIARVDLGRANGIAASQISHAQTMYVNGQMSKTEVYTTLNTIPLASAEIERYLQEWEISRTAKIARPTRADLLRFFLQNEMTEAEFRAELAGYRLSARYIDWYVADAKRKLVLAAQKESEDAIADALKVKLSTVKTTYDIQIADITVQIAKLNLTIAELKASSTPEMTLAEITDLGTTVVNCQIEIKTLQVAKAQLWRQYLESRKVA